MELSRRLAAIAAFVPEGSRIADVGTDHGYVPIDLVKRGIVKEALAMDVRKGPLMRAEEHIRAYGLEGRVRTRLSDGLEQLREGEADTVVIARMGGGLMVRILEGRSHLNGCIRTYVLSPQSEWEKVRRYLRKAGMRIEQEEMVEEEGKFYPILLVKAEEGTTACAGSDEDPAWTELCDRFGPCLLRERHPVLLRYLAFREGQLEEVEQTLQAADSEKARLRLAQVRREKEQIAWAEKERKEGEGR